MDRDIDLIIIRYLFQTFLKVLHILNQEGPREYEILLLVLAVINHMDHYLIYKIGCTKQHGAATHCQAKFFTWRLFLRARIISDRLDTIKGSLGRGLFFESL